MDLSRFALFIILIFMHDLSTTYQMHGPILHAPLLNHRPVKAIALSLIRMQEILNPTLKI